MGNHIKPPLVFRAGRGMNPPGHAPAGHSDGLWARSPHGRWVHRVKGDAAPAVAATALPAALDTDENPAHTNPA